MSQSIKSLIRCPYSFRSYSRNAILRNPADEGLPDPHGSTAAMHHSDDQGTGQRGPFLSQYASRSLTFAEKNARNRAEMQRKASMISKSWPAGTSLIDPPHREEAQPTEARDLPTSSSTITDMTTNFMIYIPYRIKQQSHSKTADKQQILRNLRVLLLKRSPTATPLPGAWTAISGRLERTSTSLEHSGDEWETPLDGALREIKEEINYDAPLFTLESALPPSLVSTPEGRQWRVWPILWQRQFPRRRHDFPLDLQGDLSGTREIEDTRRLLGHLVRLNTENVEFRWETLAAAKALSGVVPGLLDTFEHLVEHWIDDEGLRSDTARHGRLDGDVDAGSTSV